MRDLDARCEAIWAAMRSSQPMPVKRRKKQDNSATARNRKMKLVTTDMDFNDCATWSERLVVLASYTQDGLVNITQSADLFLELGLTDRTTRSGLQVYLRRLFQHHPDFLRVERGWYVLQNHQLTELSDGDAHQHNDCGDDCDILLDLLGNL